MYVKKHTTINQYIYIYISNQNLHKLIISPPSPAAQPRSGKFSCAWAPRDSLRASAAYISWAASAMRSFLVEPWQPNSGVHVILIPVIPMAPLGLWQWNIPIGFSPTWLMRFSSSKVSMRSVFLGEGFWTERTGQKICARCGTPNKKVTKASNVCDYYYHLLL